MKGNHNWKRGLLAAALAMVMLAIGAVSVWGQDTKAEGIFAQAFTGGGEQESPFATAYESVHESVVGIELTQDIYARNGRINSRTSFVGSGVVIGEGYVVTNYHVVSAGSKDVAQGISVVYQEERYQATFVAGDAESDVAVLTVKDLPATPVALGNSQDLRIGDWALVIGNPLGEQFINTLTVGVISGLDRDVDAGTTMIQTNAQVNSGNSGGGLFNIRGELVGIISKKLAGLTVEGFGFAIPIDTVAKVANDLIEYGEVKYPRLGISVKDFPSPVDEPTEDALPASIWVFEVEKDAPASQAGIKADDLITAIDGKRIRTSDELQKILRQHEAGDTVAVTVYRVPNLRTTKADEPLPKGEFLTFDVKVEIIP